MVSLGNKILLLGIIFIFLTSLSPQAFSYWIWTPKTGWTNPKYEVKDTAEEQFNWAEKFFIQGDYKRAIDEYRKILEKFPESLLAPRAQLAIGQSYYKMDKFEPALAAYQKVINDYPHSEVVKEVLELEEKLAEDYLNKNFPRQFLLPQHLRCNKAANIYQQIVDSFPYQPRAPELQYKVGWVYYQAKNFEEATIAFEKVKRNYGNSFWAAESAFMLGVIFREQCPRVLAYHQDIIDKAIESFQTFIKDYPGHRKVKQAEEYLLDLRNRKAESLFNVAEYYYKNEGSLKAAAIYYRKIKEEFGDTAWAEKARLRLLEIEEIEKRLEEEEK